MSVALSVVFTHHRFMRKLNREYLHRDYSTDVMAFSTDPDTGVEGEVYVNLDKARNQARGYNVIFRNEARRLLIHGTLHVLGYRDSTKRQKAAMRSKEDHYMMKLGESV